MKLCLILFCVVALHAAGVTVERFPGVPAALLREPAISQAREARTAPPPPFLFREDVVELRRTAEGWSQHLRGGERREWRRDASGAWAWEKVRLLTSAGTWRGTDGSHWTPAGANAWNGRSADDSRLTVSISEEGAAVNGRRFKRDGPDRYVAQ